MQINIYLFFSFTTQLSFVDRNIFKNGVIENVSWNRYIQKQLVTEKLLYASFLF